MKNLLNEENANVFSESMYIQSHRDMNLALLEQNSVSSSVLYDLRMTTDTV